MRPGPEVLLRERGAIVGRKTGVVLAVLTVVLALDVVTKRWALESLAGGNRMELFGGLLPLTLAFNRGAAFGLSIGSDPRWVFIPITVVAIVLLVLLVVQSAKDDHLRIVSSSLVLAGALGNLVDRVRWDRGVVDFLGPVNLGFAHFPIFNVADIAITCGAFALALSFWLEERELARARQAAVTPPAGDPG